MSLPTFKYHPDPLATGSVEPSDTECECCAQVRGFIYTGPVFAEGTYYGRICPWCIADGSAHEKLDASFNDDRGVGDAGSWDPVSPEVVEEIAFRTPGFSSWQQGLWWTHCGDGALFLGSAGREELVALGPQAIAEIQASKGWSDGPDGPNMEKLLAELDKDGSPTAYLFRCRKCGQFGGYWDCD